MERWVERAFFDLQSLVGNPANPAGDLEAMHRTPGQRFENEDVEGALEEVDGMRHVW
jgi:hypothetical protein